MDENGETCERETWEMSRGSWVINMCNDRENRLVVKWVVVVVNKSYDLRVWYWDEAGSS